MMTILKSTLILLSVGFVGAGGFIYSGVYNIGADTPHYNFTYFLIEMMRERSITARANDLNVPSDLKSLDRIQRGAGNYDAMCVGCHLKPGMKDSEMRKGLYPQPPNLALHAADPAKQFWVIKHGIKMTAMPAWSKGGMDDESIWDMVALLQEMPRMAKNGYFALVNSSEGHSHAGVDDHAQSEHEEDATPAEKKPQEESSHPHAQPHEQSVTPQMPTQTEPSDDHHNDSGSKSHDH